MPRRHVACGALALALIGCDAKDTASADAAAKSEVKAAALADAPSKPAAKTEVVVEAKSDAKADAKADANVDAKLDVLAEIQPRIGGTIVAVADYRVEILAYVNGRIEALVMDAKGELVADPGKLVLACSLAAKGDARAEVDLKWDAELARFVGQVAAGVELVPGAVELELAVDGKASTGAFAELALAAEASHGGQILVAGDYSIELVAEAGVVHAYAFDASGKAHAAGDLDLDVDVGGGTKLDLVWDPPSASYTAALAANVELAAKPLIVQVKVGADVAVAAVQSFTASAKLAGAGKLDAGGKLDAHADAHAPKVSAKAGAHAGASAKSGAKVETKKSASAKGGAKASGGIKIGGSAKGGIKIGG
jgi:hypothetical protein